MAERKNASGQASSFATETQEPFTKTALGSSHTYAMHKAGSFPSLSLVGAVGVRGEGGNPGRRRPLRPCKRIRFGGPQLLLQGRVGAWNPCAIGSHNHRHTIVVRRLHADAVLILCVGRGGIE